MVDIDEILAAAIRTAWLEISGPESRSPHHIEVVTARRVRHALEREGIIITPSRPMPFTKDLMVRFLCHVPN
jgi:hypothetical protein